MMTVEELRYHIEQSGKNPYFFAQKTMKFFGDTMGNYGVREAKVETRLWEEGKGYGDKVIVDVWELYRKRAVKQGLVTSAYFRKDNYERVKITG
jgi:hypothetical protein